MSVASVRLVAVRARPLVVLKGLGFFGLVAVTIWIWSPSVPRLWDAQVALYVATLLAIGSISTMMLSVEASRSFASLHAVHWTFMYIFFFVAPAVQFRMDRYPWGRLSSNDMDLLIQTNMAILLWAISWIVARQVQMRRFARRRVGTGFTLSTTGIVLTTMGSLWVCVYLVSVVGIDNLLIRGRFSEEFQSLFGEGAIARVLYFLLRGIPVSALAGSLVWCWTARGRSPWRWGLVVVAGISFLLANFPLGAARYWIGSVYLGLFLLLIRNRLRNSWPLVIVLVAGVLLVYPVMGPLRYKDASWMWESNVSSFYDAVWTGDFDAYTMIAHTIEYVREHGITKGRQLLGVVLFWVPRAWWPDKPIGSGWLVAITLGLPWNNVSSPLIAEGFINFGWGGIVLFSAMYSILLGYIDHWANAIRLCRPTPLIVVLYPFLQGFVVFQLRGDLLSSMAYMIAFVAAFLPLAIRVKRVSGNRR